MGLSYNQVMCAIENIIQNNKHERIAAQFENVKKAIKVFEKKERIAYEKRSELTQDMIDSKIAKAVAKRFDCVCLVLDFENKTNFKREFQKLIL